MMLEKIKKLLSLPEFDDENTNRVARNFANVLNAGFVILVVLLILGEYGAVVNIIFFGIVLFILGMHVLLRLRRVELSVTLFTLVTWISITYLAWQGAGIRDAGYGIYMILIFIAGLLGNSRLSGILSVLSIVSIWILYAAETTGIITPAFDSLLATAFSLTSIFILFGLVLFSTMRDLNNALTQSQENEKALQTRNDELLQLQEVLQRNSQMLEKTTEEAQLQSVRLQTITKVIEQIAVTQNTEDLLPEIANLTSKSFGFHHVGIYLLTPDEKHLLLKAASSDGGKKMLEQEHGVDVGRTSIVGEVALERNAQIALDIGEDAVAFNNPDLPETRSEMALPLIYGNTLLGVLDTQSRREAVFNEADVEIFTTLANQIAIAIQNARQFERAKAALDEMEEVSQRYVRQEWSRLQKRESHPSYRYIQGQVEKLTDDVKGEIDTDNSADLLNIPVRLREEVIGILQVRPTENSSSWKEDDVDLVETIANRVALALENARLVEDTQRRAARESAIGEIATTLSSSTDMETILRSAVQELGQKMGGAEVLIELGTETNGKQEDK